MAAETSYPAAIISISKEHFLLSKYQDCKMEMKVEPQTETI